ncbi:MAG: hypothetical protein WA354_07890, partial [Terracidiphilus sp.]
LKRGEAVERIQRSTHPKRDLFTAVPPKIYFFGWSLEATHFFFARTVHSRSNSDKVFRGSTLSGVRVEREIQRALVRLRNAGTNHRVLWNFK